MNIYKGENVVIKGDVRLSGEVNIWHNAVIRGDSNSIIIGKGTNIQDNCVIHVDKDYPCTIGNNVTIGHGAIIHGCTIEDNCLIGMGAIILNGAVIKEGSLIGAGALVSENKVIGPNALAYGSPCKVIKELSNDDKEKIMENAKEYINEAKKYLDKM